MASKTYLWIEDQKNKSGYIFWTTMMQQLCPDVIVESKKNNSELVKAVERLEDREHKYVIVFDHSFDNPQVCQEQRLLQKYAMNKNNVRVMDIICFEYILLEFEQLIDWVYAPDDKFRIKRDAAVRAREKLLDALKNGISDYKAIREVIEYDENINNHNIEQLSAKLLFDLTRNTGFEVSKGRIGDCFIQSCCEWAQRKNSDVCGLDHSRLSLKDKMRRICQGTSLDAEFANAGLEVVF